ncbi:hypothetical protein GEMRC1_010525 [Eukaryota sp. GEM-RC1]
MDNKEMIMELFWKLFAMIVSAVKEGAQFLVIPLTYDFFDFKAFVSIVGLLCYWFSSFFTQIVFLHHDVLSVQAILDPFTQKPCPATVFLPCPSFPDPCFDVKCRHFHAFPCSIKDCSDSSFTHQFCFDHNHNALQGSSNKELSSLVATSAPGPTSFIPGDNDKLLCENESCLDVSHEHLSLYRHSSEIADDPYVLNASDLSHKYACPDGSTCEKQRDPEHLARFIHVPKPQCLNGDTCRKLDEYHLEKFSHPGVLDIRNVCSDIRCDDFSREHRYQYSHKLDYVTGIMGNLKLYRTQDMEKPYADNLELSDLIKSVTKKLLSFKPVHRLSRDNFQSSVKFGCFFSIHTLATSLTNHRDIAEHVKTHHILNNYENYDHASNVLAEWTSYYLRYYQTDGIGGADISRASETNDNAQLAEKEKLELRNLGEELAKAALQLHTTLNQVGLQHHVDRELNTDKTIFANLGPNSFARYGEVSVLFKNSINRHPATFVHLSAATFYRTRSSLPNRPHISIPDEDQRVNNYYKLIQNLGNLETAEVLAKDLILAVQDSLPDKALNEITESDVMSFLFTKNSHEAIEAHLPSRVPLTDAHHVMMSRDVFNSFTDKVKEELEYLNRKRNSHFLVFTDHPSDSADYRKQQLDLLSADINYEFGYNFVLNEHDKFCSIPSLIEPRNDTISLRFDVMTDSRFDLELHSNKTRIVAIQFDQGKVSVHHDHSNAVSDNSQTRTKLYYPAQCRNFYIKFGVTFDLKYGNVRVERIGSERGFEFGKIDQPVAALKGCPIPCSLRFGSVIGIVAFSEVEICPAPKRLQQKEIKKYTAFVDFNSVPRSAFDSNQLDRDVIKKLSSTVNLTLTFVVDLTSSMKSVLPFVSHLIRKLSLRINDYVANTAAEFGCLREYVHLYMNLIGYRDILNDSGEPEAESSCIVKVPCTKNNDDPDESQSSGVDPLHYTKNVDDIVNALSEVTPSGGFDYCEDLVTPLEEAVFDDQLPAGHRMIIIFTDAPCHGCLPDRLKGLSLGDVANDNHPDVDNNGTPWDQRMMALMEKAAGLELKFMLVPIKTFKGKISIEEVFEPMLAKFRRVFKEKNMDAEGHFGMCPSSRLLNGQFLEDFVSISYEQFLADDRYM